MYTTGQPDAFFGMMGLVMSIIFGILIILGIICIISYIFMSLGLYTMAKNKNIDYAWLSWIPIGQHYIIGSLINDDVSIGSLHIPYAKIFLTLGTLGISLIVGILNLVPYIGPLLTILLVLGLTFYVSVAWFWIFSIYDKKHRVVFLVLSIIFPFLGPIFIFVIRNKEPLDERHFEEIVEVNYDSKSIIALSLGILSILSFFTFSGGILIGGVGLIFGIIAYKEQKLMTRPSGMALAGLICSIIGLALTLLIIAACVTCVGIGGLAGLFGAFSNGMYY
jgi:hypothetical protein